MLKALHKIQQTFKYAYFSFVLWLDKFKGEETYRSPTPMPTISINAAQAAYEEGLRRIKNKVAEQGDRESVEKFLEDNHDKLLALAENENNRQEIEQLKKLFVFKHKDVKTKSDMEKMIDRRIRDFKELHKHKLNRQKLRELRKQNGRPRKD